MAFEPLPTNDYWIPSFQLYDSTGTTLIYTFFAVDDTNLPQVPVATVIKENFRSSGAIVINGGTKSFQAHLHFWITGSGYQDVYSQIDNILSTITVNTPYILKVGKSPIATDNYNVKRTEDFQWPNIPRDLRDYRQEVTLNFLVNAW